MDFADLDLRTAADEESWLHLRIGDHYLYLDAAKQEGPCRVKVRSIANDAVDRARKVAMRLARAVSAADEQLAMANRQQRAELESRLDTLEKQFDKAFEAFMLATIVDWENINRDKSPVPFSKDALADMCKPMAPFTRLAKSIMDDMGNLANPLWKPPSA